MPQISSSKVEGGPNLNNLSSVHSEGGFTKLEKASLMIAQGYVSSGTRNTYDEKSIVEYSISLAKAILKDCLK